MKPIPFEAAKTICVDFEKDQCIILAWDEASGASWVTTYGVGDQNSKQACNAGTVLKDYLKLKRDNDEIPSHFKEWAIESVDRYWFFSSRNGRKFVETTFWYEKHTLERKETIRAVDDIYDDFNIPDWARSITVHRKGMDSY